MNTAKEVYDKIFKLLNKHKDVIAFDVESLELQSKLHLFGLRLKEDYGLNIDPKQVNSLNYIRVGDFMAIGWFGASYNRMISWSDDGRQPENELLLNISFPTGAFIFGEDYSSKLFQSFFYELKAFDPKYVDTVNKNLYFSMANAKEIFDNFDSILAKYRDQYNAEAKQRRIDKIKKELQSLGVDNIDNP